MKTPLSLSCIRSAAIVLAVAVGISAQGGTPTFEQQSAPAAPAGNAEKAEKAGKTEKAGKAEKVEKAEKGERIEKGEKKKGIVIAAAAVSNGNEAGLLDEAYGLLAVADHDYDGHRARAMHKIEDAAKALGSKLGGGGKAHENQGTSDSQVKSAESLLEKALGGLKGKPHRHVEEAIKQLTIALHIK